MIAAMVFIAGAPKKLLFQTAIAIIIGIVLLTSTSSYRRGRLATFLNPTRDCQAEGYQACQALIAVGSGGIAGLGLGKGVQAYGYLPESQNDSIFAIYSEKFGFLGVTALLGLFLGFFSRLKKIIMHTPDAYSRLLVVGVLAWLSTQTLINIGAMTGMLPLKGITLPFISYGGTSLVFITAAIGIVFQISRYTSYSIVNSQKVEGQSHEGTTDRRRLRGTYNPSARGRN
jgi:cell division protein FtsW